MFGSILLYNGRVVDCSRDDYTSREEAQEWVDVCNRMRSRIQFVDDNGTPIPPQGHWEVFQY